MIPLGLFLMWTNVDPEALWIDTGLVIISAIVGLVVAWRKERRA